MSRRQRETTIAIVWRHLNLHSYSNRADISGFFLIFVYISLILQLIVYRGRRASPIERVETFDPFPDAS